MQEIKHDIRCDIVAGRLVMDSVRRTDPDFESRFQTAWKHLYPDAAAPSGEDGLAAMWISSRIMLEVTDISLASKNMLIAFVRERVLQYHLLRLKPTVLVSDVRAAVLNDLTRMHLTNRDTEHSLDRTVRSYTSRVKPHLIDPNRMDFNARECALITEFYRYLVQHLAVNAVAVRPAAPIAKAAAPAPAQTAPKAEPVKEKKADSAASTLPAVKKPQLPAAPAQTALTCVRSESAEKKPLNGKEAAAQESTVEAVEEPSAQKFSAEAPAAEKKSSRRNQSPEALVEKTLRRLKGQFAIDYLMATRVEPEEDELDDDEDSELDQFIEACGESTTYKNYTAEQCTELWKGVLNEDRILFARGSLTALVDLRFTIIATRCLMMALMDVKDDERSDIEAFIEKAAEYCEAFRLDYKPEVISERLKKICRFTYLVKDKLPMSVLELLREHRQDIMDAYDLYVEQSDAEAQLREQEIARQVEDIRRKDALRRRNDQHAEIVRLIRDFGSNELGWLCMAVHGLACGKDNILYQLDGVLQKLEALGIEPFALSLVGQTFDGANPAAKDFIDMSGHPLAGGVTYRMIQPGWKYQGEIVVWPKADRASK